MPRYTGAVMMDRCRECHSTLKPDETVCFTCGSQRVVKDKRGDAINRCATFIKVCFFASALLTAASLFFYQTLSFMKCFTATVVLMFVNRSAEQMIEKKDS